MCQLSGKCRNLGFQDWTDERKERRMTTLLRSEGRPRGTTKKPAEITRLLVFLASISTLKSSNWRRKLFLDTREGNTR